MRRISTATRVIDKFGAGKDGFTNGDALSGLPATDLEDVFFDHVQEEIASFIEWAGLTLDSSNRAQMRAALLAKFAVVNGDSTKTFSVAPATQNAHAVQLQQLTALTSGRLLGAPQVFSSAAVYTRNPLATLVIVEGVGGGAGSGGAPAAASAQVSGSAGSTSGSYAMVAFTAAQIGASQSVSPGAAGAGGATGSSTGGVGGTSTFGSLMSLPGGNPSSSFGPSGAAFVVSAAPGPANPPTISTGVVIKQSRGNQGSPAIGGSGGGVVGGLAGPSPMEGGVAGAGAGANGPGVSNAGASNGVAGNPGKFIVYEYA